MFRAHEPDVGGALLQTDATVAPLGLRLLSLQMRERQTSHYRKCGISAGEICLYSCIDFQVGNYTYTCSHTHQPMAIKILNNGWLHKGAIVCPSCREMCEEEFRRRNEYCKPGEEAPPSIFYPYDELECGAGSNTFSGITLVLVMIASLALGRDS